jgi:hypothetical protein
VAIVEECKGADYWGAASQAAESIIAAPATSTSVLDAQQSLARRSEIGSSRPEADLLGL